MATKIITGDQTRKALTKIMRKTKWSLNYIAVQLECPRYTLAKIMEGKTTNPRPELMTKIAALVDAVDEALAA